MPPSVQSTPSIRRASSIQRLRSRQFHSHSEPAKSRAAAPTSEPRRGSSLLRWISSIGAGSGLGLLYWSSYSGDSDYDLGFVKRSILSFADSPGAITDGTVKERPSRSLFQKLSLPEYNHKFIFGEAFRRKVFFNYEKRIRLMSPPEKVFEYFASQCTPEGELLMKPGDLMRAVVPVFPPSESHLIRDGYLRGERSAGELRCEPSELFMLFDVNNDGHISFKEYIFFVTLLGIPESSFSVAFKMFDIDNNGEIDKEEFKKVMALMRAQNRQGLHHKNGLRTGLKVNGSVEDGGLVEYFFGDDGNKRLKLDKFVKFLQALHDEILNLEFDHYDYKSRGTISAVDFALSMVASAEMSHLSGLLDRVDQLKNEPKLKDLRITLEEFKSFAALRRMLQPFSLALFSYGKVNGLLTRKDFRRAASHICGIDLTKNVVEIIFHLFDANGDGNLSLDEFVRVLHRREKDVAQPVDSSGVLGFLFSCGNCTYKNSSSASAAP